jgi:hypothetical protein
MQTTSERERREGKEDGFKVGTGEASSLPRTRWHGPLYGGTHTP